MKPRRPPGPKLAFRRDLLALRRDPIGFLTAIARDYGDIAGFRLGPQRACLLNHPDLVRDVLVGNHRSFMKGRALQEAKRLLGEGLLTSEGERHLRQRRLIQPLFSDERVAAYGHVMSERAAAAAARWQDGATLDVGQEMMRLTLAIVGEALFDADIEDEATKVGLALSSAMAMVDRFAIPFAGLLYRLPLPATRRFHGARAKLDAIVYRMIEERRASPSGQGDLLSLLLLAQDDEEGGGMTDDQVRDEAMTLLLAGHETTAQALTWTWYLLSGHPEAEAKLHAEVDAVLGGRLPTAADAGKLPYTRMVLAEAMRLYPPAWVIGRKALADYEVGGYLIPAGTVVAVSPYLIQRDPRFFPEPERFDPERFAPEAEAERQRFAYFPFGGGPRLCIGERFAWLEGLLALASIAQRWRLRFAGDRPPELQPGITLRPRDSLPMRLERRSAGRAPGT